jgi:hypothetical protein
VTNLPDLPKNSALAAVRSAQTDADRQKARFLAGQYTTDDYFTEPVPAFFLDLPHGDQNDEISDRIALANLVAEDPDRAAQEAGTTALKDLVNIPIVVWDVRAMRGGLESGWNAYLILDFTRGNDDWHEVGNTGAKQVVVRLARAFADGRLPIKGRVIEIARGGSSNNKPLAFIAEEDF